MKNPLGKRVLRELKSDMGKYLVIFILMIICIGLTSGFLVAGDSMITAYNEGFTKYNIEDGHFVTTNKMNKAQYKRVEKLGIDLYDMFYEDRQLDNGSKMRMYADRDEVNTICLMSGEMPDAVGEIAIDRMYADNNKISIGDTITSEDGELSLLVTGLVALPDYSCLYENNNDSMFDATAFGVGIVTDEQFATFREADISYCYSWKYHQEPADDAEAVDVAEDLMKEINSEVSLESFVPAVSNNAITYTGEDFGSDKTMIEVFMYILIGIIAFVFAIIVANTVSKEASVIGTLRALGYTKGEMIRHYMAMPIVVTLISSAVGNIIGYTFMKNFVASLYYGSYSLPTYVTIWNPTAFLKTTLIPIGLMLVINYVVLKNRLSLRPIKFLRNDLKKNKNKKAVKLNKKMPFISRFSLRVILQNIPNYLVMLVGIVLGNFILMFGLGLPSVLHNYEDIIPDSMLSNYQYILTIPPSAMDEDHKVESMINLMRFYDETSTENEDAEQFSVYTLDTMGDNGYKIEDIMIYGIAEDSKYVAADMSEGDVLISSLMAEKYEIGAGDEITLKEKYEDDTYTFHITGVYPYDGGVTIFMNQDDLNKMFDLGEGYYCGYFSDSEITDIDSEYIGTTIDLSTLTKMTRQMDVSMGKMMYIVDVLAIIIFIVLLYLLSKIIIEKNEKSISMAKILGYSNGEIAKLYILPTSIMAVAMLLLSIEPIKMLMVKVFKYVLCTEMSGYLPLNISMSVFIKMGIIGVVTYFVVILIEMVRVKKIPMEEALKNVE